MDDEGTGAESPQSLILSLWETLTTYWQVELLVFLFGAAGAITLACLKLPRSRERVAAWLRHDAYGRNYRWMVRRALATTDRWLVPPEQEDAPLTAARRAWTWKLYDRCLLLAVLYPILILLLTWAITGEEGRIGSLSVLPGDLPLWQRGATIGGLALSFTLLASSMTIARRTGVSAGRWSGLVEPVVFFALFAVAGLAAVAFAGAGAGAAAGAVAVAVAVAGTVAATGAFAFAGAFAFTFAFAFAFAGAHAGAGAGAGAGTVVVAVLFTVGVMLPLVRFEDRGRLSPWAYAGPTLLLGAALGGAMASGGAVDVDGATFIAFYAVLPLCNAAFDFLSIGVTRYALRRSLALRPGWAWGIALLDLLAAAVLFLGLKVTAVAVVLALNTAAGGGPADGLFDLAELLDDIDRDEHAYWWLFLGFLTTLLPTFAHFFVGLWSVGGWLPRRAGAWLAGRAKYFSDDAIEAFWLWLGATAYATAAIALPVFVGWYAWQGLVWAYPQAGDALLDLARWLLATAIALHGPA